MILVAGSTGVVGGIAARELANSGAAVRGLVRTTSDPAKRDALAAAGVEQVEGDLRDPASLARACEGVSTVISTVSSTVSRQPGDSIEVTDRDGQLALVDAAEAAGVEHFILLTFGENPIDSPLQQAKRAVERRLMDSSMAYTILRPTIFTDSWLSPLLGFDAAGRKARIYGGGTVKHHYISPRDVAAYIVGSVGNDKVRNAILDLGGPEALSLREVVAIFEEVTGDTFTLEEVPVSALREQYEQATDSLGKSFAGLVLNYALGMPLDPAPAEEAIPLATRESVRDYAERITAA